MKTVIMVVLLIVTSGCAQILGVKKYKGSDGSVIEFTTGIDIGASLNQVDTVENTRGIKPSDQ